MKKKKLYLLTFLLTLLTTILTFNSGTNAMNIPKQEKVTKFRRFTLEEDKRLKMQFIDIQRWEKIEK